MSTDTLQGQLVLKCLDQRVERPLTLSKKKLLVGSSDVCDLKLSDKSVSSYHAFLFLNSDHGIKVKDLFSEGGVFVNGKRTEESFIMPGDIISFGNLAFLVEVSEEEIAIFNPDATILPIPSIDDFQELPKKLGLCFVDGEYCDIKFDEKSFLPLTQIPFQKYNYDFVELDHTKDPLDIALSVRSKRLEVISYMNGVIMDVNYLELKNGDYFLSSEVNSKFDILFHSLPKAKIFRVLKGELRFYPQDKISPSVSWDKITLENPLFLTSGVEQISIRLVSTSTKWKGIPLFYSDREELFHTTKVFASLLLPLLLLMFIKIPDQAPVEESVAVIYKIPEEVIKPVEVDVKSELQVEELTSQTENTGQKESPQEEKKVEFSSSSAKEKTIAKKAAPPENREATTPPVPAKAYEFKSSFAMNSLVDTAPKVNANNAVSKSTLTDTSFSSGKTDDKALASDSNVGVTKFNGADKKGSASSSYGSRGLASKSGFDSSYLEPKTVVLGSMDPELLRKIISEYIPQFRHCYQQELIGHSESIKGVIDLNFTINADGKVSKHDIRAKDARFSKKGIGCMGQVLGIINFPRPKGGGLVDVRQPLNFFAEAEKL
jgi:hypothetical protein